MASKRKRKTADRDHRAVALKGARTRAMMAVARGVKPDVSRPKTRADVAREMARRMVEFALGGSP